MKSPNVVHLHLTRLVGIHGIGSAIVSLQAPGFLHESDKRVQFVSRIAVSIIIIIIDKHVGATLVIASEDNSR